MSDPRYRPRDFCDQPEWFGKADPLAWKRPEGRDMARDGARIIAAQMQHQWALRIRARLRERRETVKSYAARPETPSYDRLVKVLRGDAVMRFEDIGLAQLILGDLIKPASAGSS